MALIVTCFALLCLWPGDAWAWGPGYHLELALDCLARAATFAPAIAALLKAYPYEFIYGCVSPDIYLSKKRAGLLQHCHNWRMGFLLLQEATTDRQRASVYGYLSHLAADVVAHNYFVPYKIIRASAARLFTHQYWELRYDLTVANATWEYVAQVNRGDFREFDRLMERVLKRTLFSFPLSQRIFKALLVVQKMRHLRRGLRLQARQSRWALSEARIRRYRRVTSTAVFGLLRDPERAPCLGGDPTGLVREQEALHLRRQVRRALRDGTCTPVAAQRWITACDRALQAAIFQPHLTWPVW